jgi:hypothetical protein
VRGKWAFPEGSAPPSAATVATALAKVTGLRVSIDDARIHVAIIEESLFDIECEVNSLELSSFIPAHPYLWENLDRVLSELGGQIQPDEIYWRPQPQLHHLRRSWHDLTRRQRFLLRLPTLGAWRGLDRFA